MSCDLVNATQRFLAELSAASVDAIDERPCIVLSDLGFEDDDALEGEPCVVATHACPTQVWELRESTSWDARQSAARVFTV